MFVPSDPSHTIMEMTHRWADIEEALPRWYRTVDGEQEQIGKTLADALKAAFRVEAHEQDDFESYWTSYVVLFDVTRRPAREGAVAVRENLGFLKTVIGRLNGGDKHHVDVRVVPANTPAEGWMCWRPGAAPPRSPSPAGENSADVDPMSPSALEAIRLGTSNAADAEVAEHLLDRLSTLMVSVSTGGPRIDDVNGSYVQAYRAHAALLKRLGLKNPNPHIDLWHWYGKWSDGSLPTWVSRRAYVADLYAPLRAGLEEHALHGSDDVLGSDHEPTGWPDVDFKLAKLRQRARGAQDVDDFKAVALQCVSVLEALGQAVFRPDLHLPLGSAQPHPNDAKQRVSYFVDSVASGSRFEHVRTLVRAAWRQAQAVKHRAAPDQVDAKIAVDSCALVVTMVRRLSDLDTDDRRASVPHNGAGTAGS